MTANDNIDLVVFDLGRVLIRIVDRWQEAFLAAGVAPDAPGRSDDSARRIMSLFAEHEVGAIDTADFLRRFAERAGIGVDDADRIMHAWLCGPYAGSMTLLDDLRGRGPRLACLSNTNDHHWRLMTADSGDNALGLDRLHFLFASHLIGAAKPDGATYEHVERKTGVAPGRILFFDDNDANVHAAASRGWRAHLVAHDGDPAGQMRVILQERRLL